MRKLFSIAIFLAISNSSAAENGDYIIAERAKSICSDGGTRQMNECMEKEYIKVDEELNAVYKKLISVLVSTESIVSAQRAWIKYRDAACHDQIMASVKGGFAPYAMNACLIDYTEERLKRLKWHLAQDCNGCPARKK